MVKKYKHQIYLRFFMVIVLLLVSIKGFNQPFAFRKINSGTKADILEIKQDNDRGVYFLTDKIYKLNNNVWEKYELTATGKINVFCPVSANDLWFSMNQVINTSLLYNFHEGNTQNIRPPFANEISCMYFISENSGLFASFTDVAVYENGKFRLLSPSPVRSCILKLYGISTSFFYMWSDGGKLVLYDNGIYKQLLDGKYLTDFYFKDRSTGFVLAGDELYRIDKTGVKMILKARELKLINKICLLENGTILMAGANGLVLTYTGNRLITESVQCKEDLTDIVALDSKNIWICGKNGRLLYSGEKEFPPYIENDHGFSSHKLISWGISTDDEYGVAITDFTGDGELDIYAVRIFEQNRLYINNLLSKNNGFFFDGFTEEVVQRNASGVVYGGNNTWQNELKLGISAVDIDNDNDQDIYLCYLNSTNKLLLNNGSGFFRNVSEKKSRACDNYKRSNAAAFADVDLDGDLDLFITSEEGSNRLFANDGTGHFTDITQSSGLATAAGGMCASFADVDNDGYPDLCVSFWYPSNKLYINETKQGKIHCRDITARTDLAKATPSKSNAVTFADVNNDGFIDLFIANRNSANKLYINNGKGGFTDRTREYFPLENFLTNGAVFADFDLDGFLDLYITNVGESVLYKNMNGKYFMDVTADFGAEISGYCTGCAVGDIDNNGGPDLYVANYINGNSKLFMNIFESANFAKFRLHGVRSNRDAIGAKIWLYKKTGAQTPSTLAGYREMNGGSGYASISAKEMIFGLEPGAQYFALIKFPCTGDTLKVDGIVAGKTFDVSEMNGLPALYQKSRSSIVRFFKDSENQPEIIKFALMIMLLVLYNLKLRDNVRRIVLIRWLGSAVILIVFTFINSFLLFSWPRFSFFIAPAVSFVLIALLHLYTGRILLKRMAFKERLDLREKLSRDLHDDLASTLGSISIYAGSIESMDILSPKEFKRLSVKVAGLAQSALQSIRDIIWMTSPRNDSLQNLIVKTTNYMLEILTDNKINFIPTTEIPDDSVILPETVRNNVFLILKEALHNIIKHSGSQNVEFTVALKNSQCFISLKDDGVGIKASSAARKSSPGHGLINMQKRSQESGIELIINTKDGMGTEIMITFKI